MRELKFLNPTQHPGLNLTVREGTKWANVKPAEMIKMVGTNDGVVVGHARVAEAMVLPDVDDIADGLLEFEHDPACRTFEGLKNALAEAYPEGWGPVVTLLFYVVSEQP